MSADQTEREETLSPLATSTTGTATSTSTTAKEEEQLEVALSTTTTSSTNSTTEEDGTSQVDKKLVAVGDLQASSTIQEKADVTPKEEKEATTTTATSSVAAEASADAPTATATLAEVDSNPVVHVSDAFRIRADSEEEKGMANDKTTTEIKKTATATTTASINNNNNATKIEEAGPEKKGSVITTATTTNTTTITTINTNNTAVTTKADVVSDTKPMETGDTKSTATEDTKPTGTGKKDNNNNNHLATKKPISAKNQRGDMKETEIPVTTENSKDNYVSGTDDAKLAPAPVTAIKDDKSDDVKIEKAAIPYVTLHAMKEQEVLTIKDTLDNMEGILRRVSPSSAFLSQDLIPKEWSDKKNHNNKNTSTVQLACLQRLYALLGTATEKESSVLMILVLLLRIEVAVSLACSRNSHTHNKDTERTNKTKELTTKGKKKKAKQQQHSKSGGKSANKPSEKLSTLVERIETSVKVLQSLNVAKLTDIVAPLVEAGFWSLKGCREEETSVEPADNSRQNLLVTPLPVLRQLLSSFQRSDHTSFDKWEKAWTATMRNIHDLSFSDSVANATGEVLVSSPNKSQPGHIATPKAGEESQSNKSVESPDPTGSSPVSEAAPTPSSSPKKNKKRRNKRRKRKNQGAADAADATTSPPGKNEPVVLDDPPNSLKKEKDDADNTIESGVAKDQPEPDVVDASVPGDDKKEEELDAEAAGAGETTVVKALEASPPNRAEKLSDRVENPGDATVEKTDVASEEISPNATFDSEKLNVSISDDTASTKSESTKHNETEAVATASKGDFSVSRVHGIGTVVVAPTTGEPLDASSAKADLEGAAKVDHAAGDDNHDEWETVEVKSRGNRKKSGRTMASSSNNGNSSHGGKKKSKSTRTSESRRRMANRKLAKDLLSSVLDSVDEEVKRRRQQEARAARSASGATASTTTAWKDGNRPAGQVDISKKEATARDALLGRQTSAPQKQTPQPASKGDARQVAKNAAALAPPMSARTKDRNIISASPVKGSKIQGATADQNTATTAPETVSAVSDSRRTRQNADRHIARSDSSSVGTDDNLKQDPASVPTQAGKDSSPAPPLPTLLNPGNANSSSSSVASSLEAPHAGHGHHHTCSSNEADVGYHLLDVCDRLTRDMHVFMARRSAALSTRRRERGALLAALQDSVSSIWAGHSHVELYGSCATMLDLPSSDLDVVVCGLDHVDATMTPTSPHKGMGNFGGSPGEGIATEKMKSDGQLGHHHHSMPQFVPLQQNAERVVRLAADLERQPWAVHVKAIPTASVPVVKVLADPSRLPGATPTSVEEEEWIMQQQHAANQNLPVPNNSSVPTGQPPANVPQYDPSLSPVWRGADVLNGLLKLDITFEGPEHGGIGSTEFSTRVVQNMCEETGLAAESTAFVQVIMVLKEVLAQRRLNEPFSGGLSSYALLLLVLAVVCERKVIREELDRVERQRRAVAAGGGNSELSSPSKSEEAHKQTEQRAPSVESNISGATNETQVNSGGDGSSTPRAVQGTRQTPQSIAENPAQSDQRGPHGNQQRRDNAAKKGAEVANSSNSTLPSGNKSETPAGNSWALIAMGKNSTASAKATPGGKETKQPKKAGQSKPSSFADAVARSAPLAKQAKTSSAAQPGTQTKKMAGQQVRAANSTDAKKQNKKQQSSSSKGEENARKLPTQKNTPKTADSGSSKSNTNQNAASDQIVKDEGERNIEADERTSKFNNYSSEQQPESVISSNQSVFPQGFNDVIEVLCSGETTPGKLLMHFLLFYGQHFDAHATAIDISGKHHRDIASQSPPYTHLSPYIQRKSAGTIDPVTGMLTVDPIVVYDPLEGAENNNVARRCFLWSSVKWVFAQSYMTLSSAVERNTTPPGTPGSGSKNAASMSSNRTVASNESADTSEYAAWSGPYNPSSDKGGNLFDPSSPLLELLLSF